MRDEKEGLIHLYLGDGKGKTCAAAGLAARMLGRDFPVVFAQFLKSDSSGETVSLRRLGARLIHSREKFDFTFNQDETAKRRCAAAQDEILAAARDAMEEMGEAAPLSLVVLDEVLDALDTGNLSEEALRSFVAAKKRAVELVLTGRKAPPWLREAASYISVVQKEKHPFDCGIAARRGVEF